MKILAIETSCDDTGIAILEVSKTGDFSVLSNIVASQIKVHKKYGGVYPMMAKREHQRNLLPTLIKALKESKLLKISKFEFRNFNFNRNSKLEILNSILEREPELLKKIVPFLKKYKKPDIDLISVTNGPGLEPCLWVGINFAKALSYFWNIPIVPVNHIESHILTNFLNKNSVSLSGHNLRDRVLSDPTKILFPAVCLVVSGGHTQLILMKKIGKYKILGETRDDAAGECFDKCAKILGLGYPGGPIIAKLASHAVIPSLTGNPKSTSRTLDSRLRGNDKFLPRPMINTKDYDFSFSGLKTAVLYHYQNYKKSAYTNSYDRRKSCTLKFKQYQQKMAVEIQQAIIDVLIKKTIKAAKDYKAKTLILGGGVSANTELRKQFLFEIRNSKFEIHFLVPLENLSTDNGLMTAIAGFYHQKQKVSCEVGSHTIKADGNLRIE